MSDPVATPATSVAAWAQGDPDRLQVVSQTDRHGKPLKTVINLDTGLVRNDPIPGDAELAQFYAQDYRTAYKGAEKPRGRQIIRNFRRAAEHIGAFTDVYGTVATVLDVGAGSGEFAFLMRERGKSVTGIEPNQGYATYCREDLGLDIQTAHLAPDLFSAGQFDLIRLNHVLEHLNDPVRYLGMMAAWLAPGGTLYVEVPNIETYAREKSRGNMFHYGHIFNFNPWTLRAVAGLAGLAERGDTAERCADTTGVFLGVKAGPVPAPPRNLDNATHVLALIEGHYKGAFQKGKATKPLAKLAARVEEMVSAGFSANPRAIGKRIARTLPGA